MLYFLVLETLSRYHLPPRFRNIPDETVKTLAFCLAIATWDRCSCRQQVRRIRLRRRFADPLSTISIKKIAMQIHVVTLDSSLLFKYVFGTRRDGLYSLLRQRHSVFLRPRPRPQVQPCAPKGHVAKAIRCCPG